MDNTIAKLLDLFKHISRDIMIYAISGFVVIVNFFIIDKFYLGGIYFVLIEKLEYISLIIFILSYVIGHVIMALTNVILNFKKIFECNKTKLNIHKFEKEFEFEVKIFNKNQTCSCSVELKTTSFSTNLQQNINYVKSSLNKPILNKTRTKKEDLIFVLTAGIIPCPGTVLLFVYAFLLKTYFSVILASISISLGMATVIFLSAFCGVSLNKASSKSKRFLNILEIVSPIFMFILALLLFKY